MKPNVRLIAALVLIGAIWALTFPLTKIAVLGGYRNFGIIFWSSNIAVVTLGVIVAVRGLRLPLHGGAVSRYVFVAFLGTILPSALSYTAAEHLPSGVISVCMSIIPMVSFPLAIAVGLERATWSKLLGLVLGLAGVLLITLPETSLPDPTKAIFIPLALLAVLCYAIEGVGLGRIGRAGLDPIQLLLGACLITSILTLPIAMMTGTFFTPHWPFGPAEAAVLLSGLANATAYAGFVWMVGRGGPVFASQVAYVVTGFGVVWSMILVGETYSLWVWGALAVIFAGLFLTQPRPARDGAGASAIGVVPEVK
jgi:drug/metabolite transporter (DMT)-like permease